MKRTLRAILVDKGRQMTLETAFDTRNMVVMILRTHGSDCFREIWSDSEPQLGFWRQLRGRFQTVFGRGKVEMEDGDEAKISTILIDVMLKILEHDLASKATTPTQSLAYQFLGDRKFSTFLNDREVSFLDTNVFGAFQIGRVDLGVEGLAMRVLNVVWGLCD
ncbi:hypothetical protein HDU67_001395 [Dinochytrium kinnereticum]|nr:hypothetical protein HDU67_001395 [Dinochytrium kinnereticum]